MFFFSMYLTNTTHFIQKIYVHVQHKLESSIDFLIISFKYIFSQLNIN